MCEDIYSKWVEAKAVPNITAPEINGFIQNVIISRYGPPTRIITGLGAPFRNKRLQ